MRTTEQVKLSVEHADVAVMCLGLDATIEGEQGDARNEYASGDKLGLNLPGLQEELLETVAAMGKPVVVLLMAGSFGVKTIVQIYRDIIRVPMDFQMIVITGKNQRLYQTLKTTVMLSPKKTKLILFTQKVEQYMQASDLIITKPGGLTVTEALASNLPLLVFDSIPGQEEDNADFLELHGMARRLHKNESCTDALKELLEDKMQLASMEQACKNFDKSDGCAKIVSLMKDMIK